MCWAASLNDLLQEKKNLDDQNLMKNYRETKIKIFKESKNIQ